MNIGDKLRSLREYYGYSQSELGRHLEIPPRNISNYETISEPTGVLDYITKFCIFFKMPVAEFFMEDLEDLKNKLPDYITPADAAVLKILNTAIDPKSRIEIKKVFIHAMKAVLVMNQEKLGHMPEYRKIFGEYDLKVAEVQADYKPDSTDAE